MSPRAFGYDGATMTKITSVALEAEKPKAGVGYRVARLDSMNWTLEKWHDGGKPCNLPGGKVSRPGWNTVGYYSSLESAARAALDKEAGLLWGELEPLDAIREATRRVVAAVRDVLS